MAALQILRPIKKSPPEIPTGRLKFTEAVKQMSKPFLHIFRKPLPIKELPKHGKITLYVASCFRLCISDQLTSNLVGQIQKTMPRPNFYLERPKPGTPAPITLSFKWGREHLNMSTKEKVLPEHWDKKAHRVSEKFLHLNYDYTEVNRVLDEITMFVNHTYNQFRRQRKLAELTRDKMKQYVMAYREGRTDGELAEPVLNYYRRFVEERGADVTLTEATKKGDEQTFKKYEAFATTLPATVYFHNINLPLLKRFRDWFFQNTTIGDSTISKHIKRFLQMCRHAAASGIEVGCDLSSIDVASQLKLSPQAKDTIALYPEEIKHLLSLNLSNKPHLENVRDLFVFFCCIGLRFNRWKEVGTDNFTVKDGTYYLDIYTKKGRKKRVIIPLDPMAKEIALKYNMGLPEVPEKSEANRQIKELCKLAGWTDLIQRRVQKRGKTEVESIPKWKAITPHTARRSFATNAFAAGLDKKDIMALTGHAQESTLMGYIKQDPRRDAERIAKHDHFNK